MILRSRLLAHVPHGFSTRTTGDMGRADNVARMASELGVPEVAQLAQVHGIEVVCLPGEEAVTGDALVSDGPAVGVRTADCAPVLIATRDGDRVAAVHAGWRGACAGILAQAMRHFDPKRVVVAIGPTIGVDAFEVGHEVIAAAEASLGEPPPHIVKAKPHLDLVGLVERQLEQLGVALSAIERVGGCTFSDEKTYFSYRRDHGETGRHLSAIAPKSR